MASMDSATEKVCKILDDQQSLLNSQLMNEVLEIKCSNASRPSSGVQAGFRHRLPNSPMEPRMPEYAAVHTRVPSGSLQDRCTTSLLGEVLLTTTSKGCKKSQDGFAKCMERFLSVCRSNIDIMLGRKPRRSAKSAKSGTPAQIAKLKQMELEREDCSSVPCLGGLGLGRGSCWRGFRKSFDSMIKIENENDDSVSRSVRYFA